MKWLENFGPSGETIYFVLTIKSFGTTKKVKCKILC